jgi:hypothetical protein
MKRLQIIIGIFTLIALSCEHNKPIEIDYCEMLARDQYYVNRDETDQAIREENSKKRRQIFEENYEQIIKLTKQEGFPKINFENLPQDSCKYWAVTITLIHIAQSRPEIFFSQETVALFKEEMEKGNLDSKNLAPAFRVSFMTNEFCEELQKPIQDAIESWKMESHLNRKPKFRKCS